MVPVRPFMLLSVIIVSHNTCHLTVGAVEAVYQDCLKTEILFKHKHLAAEVIVVDNASSDETVSKLAAWAKTHPSLPLLIIKNSTNLGFPKANNQAAGQARGQYLLLLNSDTILQNGALQSLLARINIPGQDILAPVLLNSDGSTQLQGGDLPSFGSLTAQMLFLDDLPIMGKFFSSMQHTGRNREGQNMIDAVEEFKQVGLPLSIRQGWVSGAALMISKYNYLTLGGLDEEIFMYGEDMEFCLRSRSHGLITAIVLGAKVLHFGSSSSSTTQAVLGEILGLKHIWKKHKTPLETFFAIAVIRLGVLLRWLIFGIIGTSQKAAIYREVWGKI